MANELTRYLVALTFASSLAIVAALALRRAVRTIFGPVASYSIWLIVPIGITGVFVPQGIDMGTHSILALSQAFDVAAAPAGEFASEFSRSELILGAWAAGASLCLLYLACQQRMFVRSLGRLSGSRPVVRAEHGSGCPAVLGVFRPRIILPADFKLRYTPLERLLILAHERIHLRRGDAAWNASVALLRCVLWFNPLVHLASAYFRTDQELACDGAVLELHPASRRSYARAMLKTELADEALPVGCHWRSIYHLKERLRMVEKPVPGRTRRMCGHVFVALVSTLIACSAWAAQPASDVSSTATDAPISASRQAAEGTRRDSIARARSAVLRPQVLSWPADLDRFYPKDAEARGTDGMVRIAVTLDKQGRATDTRILSVTPQGLGFGAAASTMVHFMTFSNPTGHRITIKLPVKFALQHGVRGRHHRSLKGRAT